MGRRSRWDRSSQWHDGHGDDDDAVDAEVPSHKEKVRYDDADTAFILGRGGKTKQKIVRVSGAQIELHERNNVVEISGTEEECRKARKYIDLVRAQRVGPVHVGLDHDDGDLTLLDVPSDCIGFVTGAQGNFLRMCEDEWGTLMFFCDYKKSDTGEQGIEQLAIFGNRVGRAGSELKVKAAIEMKRPKHFTEGVEDFTCPDEWGADTLPLSAEELSFALGKDGATRKKLARASGCVLEYVGEVAYMVGKLPERQRARDYITWLIQQRTKPVFVDISARNDATAVEVPRELTGILKGTTLRDIEQETDTFCFLEGDVDSSDRLLIFGGHRGRKQAERKVRDLVRVRPRGSPEENSERSRAENTAKTHVKLPPVLVALVEPDKLAAIQQSTGATVALSGVDFVAISGYEQQVTHAKRQLHDYMYNIKVEDEFLPPKEVPFHVFIAKGQDGAVSVLEEIRNQTRVRLKVVQEEKKIVLGGLFSTVTNAKRELHTFLGSFVTRKVHLAESQLGKVAALGKASFPRMQNFRHLCAAEVNKEQCVLSLSGSPKAVQEAYDLVAKLFEDKEWPEPKSETYSLKHNMRGATSGRTNHVSMEPEGRKAAEIIQMTEPDSAFILGRGGKTKTKIARVSGAQLELHEGSNTVEIIGTEEERRRARKYVELVRAQRVGPVNVDESHDHDDLTMVTVPHSCVGFVTGSQGNFLRSCEEEWGTLMFFCDYQGPGAENVDSEKLAIFGGRTGRTGAELKVMAAIETKMPGYFTRDITDNHSTDEWASDTIPLGDEELSFALGKDGSTRKKLARASGCILEYVGNIAYLAGTLGARKRAREYLGWLMKQRTGTVYVDTEGRTDVTSIDIPDELENVASVFKSMVLRGIEHETRTFCFLEGNASKSERLLIFAHEKGCREKAKAIAMEKIQQRLQAKESRENERWYGRGGDGWYDDYWKGWQDWKGSWKDDWKKPKDGWRKESEDWRGWSGGGRDEWSNHDNHYGSNKDYNHRQSGGYGGNNHNDARAEQSEVTDHFSLRGDISIHVVMQTGLNGEDPLIEEVETSTGTRLTVLRDKACIELKGMSDRVAQAKKQLQQFADKFVTCKVQMKPEITAELANKVNHYIRPMPWISGAEVDEQRDLLKIQGHQDSVERSFQVLRDVYKAHGLELTDSDITMRGRASDDPVFGPRPGLKGKSADVLRVSEDDAAFILGRGGKTKHKIARVSGAALELHERNNTVEIFGGELERRKAYKYVELVRAQRVGPVNVDESHDDGDLTMIAVPHSCVGFVTGSQGNFLRTCEEEWGTLMFFCDYQGPGSDGLVSSERLAIFGDLAGRCGAELKVMAAIETKLAGYYTTNLGETHCPDEWGTDTVPLDPDQLSYALGKKGATRRKLAKASGCIMEYVGNVAFLAGTLEARVRGREYLGWMCDQVAEKMGRISVDPKKRGDVTLVPVPQECIGYVMGDRRNTLSRLEEDWNTLIFFVDTDCLPGYSDIEGLAIFGDERGRAGTELKVMGAVEAKVPLYFTRAVGDVHSPEEWGVDTLPLSNEELSFALGKDGSTRKKLARASGCVLEYVGNVAYMAGTLAERLRAREYLRWLMKQRGGAVTVDVEGRHDITVVDIPEEMRGMVKAMTLREVEKETGTYIFFQGDISTASALLVCGHREEDRQHAEGVLQDIIVKGATHKPTGRPNGDNNGRRRNNQRQDDVPVRGPRRRPPRRQQYPPRRRAEQVSSDSESQSESGSGSMYSSDDQHAHDLDGVQQAQGSAAVAPPTKDRSSGFGRGGYASRRRQWASEESASDSNEEIIPYWK